MTTPTTHLAFVYGSLLSGLENHGALHGATYHGPRATTATFTLRSLSFYPGVHEGGTTAVQGELYEVDAAGLRRLDRLEGHPSYYRRTEHTLSDGTVAWIYLLPESTVADRPIVANGCWRTHHEAQVA